MGSFYLNFLDLTIFLPFLYNHFIEINCSQLNSDRCQCLLILIKLLPFWLKYHTNNAVKLCPLTVTIQINPRPIQQLNIIEYLEFLWDILLLDGLEHLIHLLLIINSFFNWLIQERILQACILLIFLRLDTLNSGILASFICPIYIIIYTDIETKDKECPSHRCIVSYIYHFSHHPVGNLVIFLEKHVTIKVLVCRANIRHLNCWRAEVIHEHLHDIDNVDKCTESAENNGSSKNFCLIVFITSQEFD